MRRFILPVLLTLVTLILLLSTANPVMALGFGVVTYGGIAFMQQAAAAIRTRELSLPRRYGLNFYYTGTAAVAQGWFRLGVGALLVGAGVWFGAQALFA